jgi:hypothetical protein
MQQTTAFQRVHKVLNPQESWPLWFEDDQRWALAQRVVAGTHFARSPLLSKFLLFVVAGALEGRENEITEHHIGIQVFSRPSGYSTVEDNIVRNYARQLRKRLAEHFAGEGSAEKLRIDIPLGGYVPFFHPVTAQKPTHETHSLPMPVSIQSRTEAGAKQHSYAGALPRWNWKRWLLGASVALTYSAALVSITWFVATQVPVPRYAQEPSHPLWAALFGGSANTYIVPADAGFNLLEDLSGRPVSLADYIKGGYLKQPLAGLDAHSADDLRSQQFTSFVDYQIIASMTRLQEYNPQRAFLRFPRDLRLDDLKNANAILIGSVGSNPWASIADSNTNFHIVYRPDMQGATIINKQPLPGEASSYSSHWSEPAHETYALIAFLPNLDGNGHLLLLQGLDVAGTQAAAETLLHQEVVAPVLHSATRPDGSIRHFEILLRSTSIESSSAGTQVVASRIY